MPFKHLDTRVFSRLGGRPRFARQLRSLLQMGGAGCRSVAPLSLVLCLSMAAHAASVKDFGARGDGRSDDTSAIQQAIDSTGSGTLLFPSGTYIISSPLYLRGNVTYQGQNNPVLTGTRGDSIFVFPQSGANNITVSGFIFDDGQLRTEGNSEAPNNVKITGNTFRNLTVDTQNWTLQSAIFSSNGLRNSSIDHNTFSNVMINGTSRPDGTLDSIDYYAIGIFMYGVDSTSITNNTFNGVGEGIKICFTQTYPSNAVNIGHNTISGIHRMGMEIQGSDGCGHPEIPNPSVSNMVIEYNDVHINNDPYWNSFGISLADPSAQSPVVRYNRVIGELPIALNVPGIGIEAGGQSAQVYGNTVEGYYGLAIGLFGGSTNAQYHDNYTCSFRKQRHGNWRRTRSHARRKLLQQYCCRPLPRERCAESDCARSDSSDPQPADTRSSDTSAAHSGKRTSGRWDILHHQPVQRSFARRSRLLSYLRNPVDPVVAEWREQSEVALHQ